MRVLCLYTFASANKPLCVWYVPLLGIPLLQKAEQERASIHQASVKGNRKQEVTGKACC